VLLSAIALDRMIILRKALRIIRDLRGSSKVLVS
jgi:hypothetical protein